MDNNRMWGVIGALIVVLSLGTGCSHDLSRSAAESAIREQMKPYLSSHKEGTYSMRLWLDGIDYDPAKDLGPALVRLEKEIGWYGLMRRVSLGALQVAFERKKPGARSGSQVTAYFYYYSIVRGPQCATGCVDPETGQFINGQRRLTHVTGIQVTGDTSRTAEFEYTLVPTPWALDMEESTENGEAKFSLYDDGWHLEDIKF